MGFLIGLLIIIVTYSNVSTIWQIQNPMYWWSPGRTDRSRRPTFWIRGLSKLVLDFPVFFYSKIYYKYNLLNYMLLSNPISYQNIV